LEVKRLDWQCLSLNPHPEAIKRLCKNPNTTAIELLKKNRNKINCSWFNLSSNPTTIDVLKENPAIFTLDYKTIKIANQEIEEVIISETETIKSL
jgi:hypothetical protein